MKWKLIVNPKPLKAKSSRGKLLGESMPVCTLILPNSLYKSFLKNWKGRRAGARCLKEILFLYTRDIENTEKLNPNSLLLLYQKKENDQRKKWSRLNFRPDVVDWSRLGLLARKHGVSRCYLFSYLLEKYFSGESGPKSVNARKRAA